MKFNKEFNFLNKTVNVDGKGRQTTVGSIILAILLVIFRYYSDKADDAIYDRDKKQPETNIVQPKEEELPDVLFIQTDTNRKTFKYQLDSSSQYPILTFPVLEICKSTKELEGYCFYNVQDVSSAYAAILTRLICAYHCMQDYPKSKEFLEERVKKIKEVLGPALAQCTNLYKDAKIFTGSLDKYYGVISKSLKEQAEQQADIKMRYPFEFGKKYSEEGVYFIAKEISTFIDNDFASNFINKLIEIHPKVLTFNVEYIIDNLCATFYYPYEYAKTPRKILFAIPKYLSHKKEENGINITLTSVIDNEEDHYALMKMPSGIQANSAKEYLTKLGDQKDAVKKIINKYYDSSKITDLETTVGEIEGKSVLAIDFKSKTDQLFNTHKLYIITSAGHIWCFFFKVSGLTEKESDAAMERHRKLTEFVIFAAKVEKAEQATN